MKLTANDLPESVFIKLTHLRKGNSSNNKRHGKSWRTIAQIVHRDDPSKVLATGESFCSDRDNPSRKIGREVAIGRAVKQFFTV